ncbi:MAG: PLP-dependent aspartate aminotransferase family protein [Planctomycetota bacterium]
MEPNECAARTWLIVGGRSHEPGAPANQPITPASSFLHGTQRSYARSDGNPTTEALEALVGGLEGGRAVAYASGMAAVAAVFDRVPTGGEVVLSDDCYHGSSAFALRGERLGRWRLTRVAQKDTGGWIEAASRADLLWLESPSNPLLVVADLPAICRAPRASKTTVAVDSTFATPLLLRGLDLDADLVVHSATKAIGGHSDLLLGLAVTRRDDIHEELLEQRALTGATPGVLESYLATRGARTLALRFGAAQTSAGVLAERLEAHPKIERVRYPGLASHPTHALALRDLAGFGTLLSFDVAGGAPAADALCSNLRLIQHATSLGGVESTIERRARYPGQEHLPPGLLRLSVGCEDTEDLWRDLERASRA